MTLDTDRGRILVGNLEGWEYSMIMFWLGVLALVLGRVLGLPLYHIWVLYRGSNPTRQKTCLLCSVPSLLNMNA